MPRGQGARFCSAFRPRNTYQQMAAIGLTSSGKLVDEDCYPPSASPLPPALARCFDPSTGDWEDIEPPQEHEWLDSMIAKTPDQAFKDFVHSRPLRPDRQRKIIYLQPLCEPQELEGPAFPKGSWPSWKALQEAVSAFYAPMTVRTLPAKPMESLRPLPKSRQNCFGTQYNASQILDAMRSSCLPHDAYCVLAVTMWDLYPREEWNFVYGLASLQSRVGVFSFVRHTPDERGKTAEWTAAQMLHRSMKTMIHEIGHMFGMKHCTWYNCLMRGSNGEGVEHQLNYLHLCPVCLRKLHWSIGFDVPAHYQRQLQVYQEYEDVHDNFARDCSFLRRRLEALEDLPQGSTKLGGAAGKESQKIGVVKGVIARSSSLATQKSSGEKSSSLAHNLSRQVATSQTSLSRATPCGLKLSRAANTALPAVVEPRWAVK
eukprot:TRINITY_DN109924_c0_g1_i1.p1 TRINITY_DN109924_c0_g1~~TRINITY_DN109924_c0_g1_i1.p1  ORF type:complete len:429 (-),score=58.47 TRINITY_DN109924_c0_g1_i1:349-1635(-)